MEGSYVVVGWIAVSENRFPWLVVPDGVSKGRPRWRVLAIEVAHAELAWPLEVFMHY
jgi:hypothetical protein